MYYHALYTKRFKIYLVKTCQQIKRANIFITLIFNEWKIDQICIDHYRMLNEYVAKNFGERFF